MEKRFSALKIAHSPFFLNVCEDKKNNVESRSGIKKQQAASDGRKRLA
jgi:hypothetical protein